MSFLTRIGRLNLVLAAVALSLIAAALLHLRGTTAGLSIRHAVVEQTPVTIFRPLAGPPGPVVVIAHGFAGSQQLMQPFAVTLARNGFVAVTFDFRGHGRNPLPLTGDITRAEGATRTLVAETASVAAFARPLGDGRLAVLGHSMASDIIVRFAQAHPEVAATVAVSMFSPVVTPTSPRNLLVIVGDLEGMLKREALRVVGQVSAPAEPVAGQTYGSLADGTARRAAFSPDVEHIGVLYSRRSMAEALAWLDGAFGIAPPTHPYLDGRGLWIVALLAGIVMLGRPLSRLLPVLAPAPAGAGLGWRRLWPLLVLPAIATPLILRLLPTHFLPVLVGDYLAAHFAMYGLLNFACMAWFGVGRPRGSPGLLAGGAITAGLVTLYALGALGLAVDSYVTSFVAGAGRAPLILAMLVGTLVFFVTDEWMTRGAGAARGAYAASKVAFLLSLAIAVGLDFGRLFFLVIIVPVTVLFFVIYGLFSAWVYRRTNQPLVAALANATAFAWAIGVTFPLVAG